jgi:hypothetical protein
VNEGHNASPDPTPPPPAHASSESELAAAVRAHLRFGWIALLVFGTLGLVLEALHAFKSGAYLGVGNETRRLMWTLAHAHGIGLSLLNMVYAATLHLAFVRIPARLHVASRMLRWGSVLLPGGFFLGGFLTYGGDPGLGVLLAPIGALLVWLCALFVALAL